MAHGIFWSRAVAAVLALAASCHGATHEVRLSDRHSFSCGTPPYCTGLVGAPNKGTLLCYCQVYHGFLGMNYNRLCEDHLWLSRTDTKHYNTPIVRLLIYLPKSVL